MSSILGKIEKAVNIASTVSNIASKVNSSGLLNGVNLKNIKADEISSIGNLLQGNIDGMASNLTSQISGAVDTSQFENMASSITPEDLGMDLDMSEFTSQFGNIEGLDTSILNGISFK